MGRRSSRNSPGAGAALPFDTTGVTILPGVPLPGWSEQTTDESAGSLEAAAGMAPPDSGDPTPRAAQQEAVPAMAGSSVVAASPGAPASMGASVQHAADPAGYGPPRSPEPVYAAASGYGSSSNAAPGYGSSTNTGPGYGSSTNTGPGYGSPTNAGPGYGSPTNAAPGYGSPTNTAPGYGSPTTDALAHDPGPATAPDHLSGPGMGGVYDSPTGTAPAGAEPAGDPADVADATVALPTPSQVWTSSDRPELSAEHVALLTWWADMIAAGQFPGAPGGDSPQSAAMPQAGRRRRRGARGSAASESSNAPGSSWPVRGAALGLGVLVLAGLAAVTVLRVLGGDETPSTADVSMSTTMPVTVGDLVLVTDPDVGDALQPLLGFGLRPGGITVTRGYGVDPAGPVALAAMATSATTAGDAAAQLETWAARTEAEVGEPVAGTGRAEGITCAPVDQATSTPAGAVCIWTATDLRGQTYVIGADVPQAQERTAELRAELAPDSATTD